MTGERCLSRPFVRSVRLGMFDFWNLEVTFHSMLEVYSYGITELRTQLLERYTGSLIQAELAMVMMSRMKGR